MLEEIQSTNEISPNFEKLLEDAKLFKHAGKAIKESSCWYYYGQLDSRLWWGEPYYKALKIKRALAVNLIDELLSIHYMERDSYRISRISNAIKDIDKMLADDPKLTDLELLKFKIIRGWNKWKQSWTQKITEWLKNSFVGYYQKKYPEQQN